VLKITWLIVGVATEGFELQKNQSVLKGKRKSWELEEAWINGELDLISWRMCKVALFYFYFYFSY